MSDVTHMLLCMIAGMIVGAVAAAYAGVPAALVVIVAAGWATAQYDHLYKRARNGG